jgi:hypothetical protein
LPTPSLVTKKLMLACCACPAVPIPNASSATAAQVQLGVFMSSLLVLVRLSALRSI